MSERTYLQHGRRHGPGGTDPIPGARGQFCHAAGGTYSVGAGLDDYLFPWTLGTNTDTDVFGLNSITHTNDTITVAGGVVIVTASAYWPTAAANNSAFTIQSTADTIRHSANYPLGSWGDAPQAGFATIVDQAILYSSGSIQIRLKISNGAAFTDGPQDTQMAVVFIPTN